MEGWVGGFLFLASVWILYSGWSHRARILARREELKARNEYEPTALEKRSFATRLSSGAAPLIILLVGVVALKMTFMFNSINPDSGFSHVDLYGFLAFLAAYAIWMILKTSYPLPKAKRGTPTSDTPSDTAPQD